MHMGVGLVQVYNEGGDVLLTVSVTYEVVHVLGPLFNITTALQVGVIGILAHLHLLVTECQFQHPVAAASKDEVDHRPEAWLSQPLVGVIDATRRKVLGDALRYAPGLIDRQYLATTDNLEVQVFACRVIVARSHCMLQALL